MDNDFQHIVTRITDEGLVVEVFALQDAPLFDPVTDQPTALLRSLSTLIVDTAQTVNNSIAIGGHVEAQPIVLADSTIWSRSMDHATAMRELMEAAGLDDQRIERVTGHADREPSARNPMALRNNRLEIVFLRE